LLQAAHRRLLCADVCLRHRDAGERVPQIGLLRGQAEASVAGFLPSRPSVERQLGKPSVGDPREVDIGPVLLDGSVCLDQGRFALGKLRLGLGQLTIELAMPSRLEYPKASPEAYKTMLALSSAVAETGQPPKLIDLVNYRVSQLNGCAYCLDTHSKHLRVRGETEERLYMISAWRDAPHLYNDRERGTLAWAEAVTKLEHQQVADGIYDMARQAFSEAELSQLTMAVVAINGWNRFHVAFHRWAGDYQSEVGAKSA
jgi:AhpD family alkylhydroperoxidase